MSYIGRRPRALRLANLRDSPCRASLVDRRQLGVSVSARKASQDFPGEYHLDVEDFGPIVKASVDLRPLTVFIGPSNTGKSYLSILVYALHQCFGDRDIAPYGRQTRYRNYFHRSIFSSMLEANKYPPGMLETFGNWLSQQVDAKSQTFLPKDVDAHIRKVFEQVAELSHYFEHEIGRCFGVDNLSLLVRISSSSSCAKAELSIPRSGSDSAIKYGINIDENGARFSGKIGGSEPLSIETEHLSGLGDLVSHFTQNYSLRGVEDVEEGQGLKILFAKTAEEIFHSLLNPLYRNAYYLPADRTGVMHSHQVVVSTLVQNAATAGLRPSASIPILSGVLADFLSQLIEMSGGRDRIQTGLRRSAARLADGLSKRLEQDVLKGAVRLNDAAGEYPSFDYRPEGWDKSLPLMRASSMVSELAPVVLYLRHLVGPGDILIIEEPESHLHPAMQVEFTRQLAAVVRAGIRVIVTTHSEWLLQELANLVRLSQVSEAERSKIAGGDVALDTTQVGAWLFKPDASGEGSTVSEIGLDESGLYPSGFDDVGIALHNDWAEISSRIGGGV